MSETAPERTPWGDASPGAGEWSAARVRRLRQHLGDTQSAFAERLGTRQQTVSEWETGASRPRGMSRRLLRMVAEEAGFYDAGTPVEGGPESGVRGERA